MTITIPSLLITLLFYLFATAIGVTVLLALIIFSYHLAIKALQRRNALWYMTLYLNSQWHRDNAEVVTNEWLKWIFTKIRYEDPKRYSHLIELLRFGETDDITKAVIKAVEEYQADPEKQKRTDLYTIIYRAFTNTLPQ